MRRIGSSRIRQQWKRKAMYFKVWMCATLTEHVGDAVPTYILPFSFLVLELGSEMLLEWLQWVTAVHFVHGVHCSHWLLMDCQWMFKLVDRIPIRGPFVQSVKLLECCWSCTYSGKCSVCHHILDWQIVDSRRFQVSMYQPMVCSCCQGIHVAVAVRHHVNNDLNVIGGVFSNSNAIEFQRVASYTLSSW